MRVGSLVGFQALNCRWKIFFSLLDEYLHHHSLIDLFIFNVMLDMWNIFVCFYYLVHINENSESLAFKTLYYVDTMFQNLLQLSLILILDELYKFSIC